MGRTIRCLVAAAVVAGPNVPAVAIDAEHRERAEEMIGRAIEYLRSEQDPGSGGWAVNPGGPQFPAITGLVVTGMLMQPGIDGRDPAVARGVEFMLSFRQPDGGIYDRLLPSYNTSICLSALAKLGTPAAEEAIPGAQALLRSLQYSEDAAFEGGSVETLRVGPSHPFYGGIGYGRHGRPDNSNLQLMLQALHDSGVEGDDPAFQRALVFLARTQMLDEVNDQPYADGSKQGGFIYATAESGDRLGAGQSFAGLVEETIDEGELAGRTVSRLRAYGSMTYGGFKSLIYADLPREDPRVAAAEEWIRRNYTLEENPGVGTDGFYYYVLTFARALAARGGETIEVRGWTGSGGESVGGADAGGESARRADLPGVRDWQNDLIDRLAELQNEDGSFRVVDDRWMEDNPVLITAYALIALQHAVRE